MEGGEILRMARIKQKNTKNAEYLLNGCKISIGRKIEKK